MHAHAHIHACAHTYMCTHKCTYMHVHTHTNTHVHAHTYMHTYIHMHMHAPIHVHAHVHACMHAHTHIHTCMHIPPHTCIHIHTCTQTHAPACTATLAMSTALKRSHAGKDPCPSQVRLETAWRGRWSSENPSVPQLRSPLGPAHKETMARMFQAGTEGRWLARLLQVVNLASGRSGSPFSPGSHQAQGLCWLQPHKEQRGCLWRRQWRILCHRDPLSKGHCLTEVKAETRKINVASTCYVPLGEMGRRLFIRL